MAPIYSRNNNIEKNLYQELDRQIHSFNLLYELMLRQKSFIENGDLDSLYSSKKEKDRLVETIRKQGRRLYLLQKDWPQCEFDISPEYKIKINELIHQLTHIVEEVLNIEKQNCELLERCGESVRKSFRELATRPLPVEPNGI